MLKPYSKIPFEGRDDLIEIFQKALEGKKPDEYRILVFHGMSGIGKTRLLEELEKVLLQKWSYAIHVTLDFETRQHQDIENGLFHLRKTLKEQDIIFNIFDIAYAIYWQKIKPNTPLASNNFPLWEEAGLIADIISFAKDIPGASLIPKSGEILLKGKEHLKNWWIKQGEPMLRNFESLKPFEMEKYLPVFLAEDVKQHFNEHRLPVVIFIDTYQALWSKNRNDANKFTQDEWIRSLVENLPEAYWVIAGYDKICWSELDKGWDEKIKHYYLVELLDDMVFEILEQCEIMNKDIQERIFEGSKGVPFYIQLSIENYNKIIEKEKRQPVIDDFGKSYREIFERFAKYLDLSVIATLKVLSCANFWDKALFCSAVKEFNTGYPLTSFDEFCSFSFIRPGSNIDTYVIHEIFKEHIQNIVLNIEIKETINKYLFKYNDNQTKEINL